MRQSKRFVRRTKSSVRRSVKAESDLCVCTSCAENEVMGCHYKRRPWAFGQKNLVQIVF